MSPALQRLKFVVIGIESVMGYNPNVKRVCESWRMERNECNE